jgi:DNA-binding MarR family transcriptional regulator
LRVTDLAVALLLDRTALSRTLDPLVERGLVAIAHGHDARTREVSLTQSGERALRAATLHWKRAQARVADTLGGAKLGALIGILGEIEALHPDPGGRHR